MSFINRALFSGMINISEQGATNDIKKCFRYAEWKSREYEKIL